MKFFMVFLGAVALTAVGLPQAAGAQASFDCAKAEHPSEIAVCQSPALAEADRTMAASYEQAKAASSSPDELLGQQRNFLLNVHQCGADTGCLSAVYSDRIGTLQRQSKVLPDGEAGSQTQGSSEDTVPERSESLPIRNRDAEPPHTSMATKALASAAAIPDTTGKSVPGWVWVLAGVSLFALVGGSVHLLNVSAKRYGYDMLFNRMAPMQILLAICLYLTLLFPLFFGPIAVLTFGVIVFNNVRNTNLVLGVVGSLIQPVALVLAFMGARWVANAMRAKT